RLVRAERRAEIAAGEILQINAVLQVERTIEAEPAAQFDDALLRRALAEHRPHGIAGDEVDEREDEGRDAQQHGNREQKPSRKEAKHVSAIITRCRPSPAGSSASRGP